MKMMNWLSTTGLEDAAGCGEDDASSAAPVVEVVAVAGVFVVATTTDETEINSVNTSFKEAVTG